MGRELKVGSADRALPTMLYRDGRTARAANDSLTPGPSPSQGHFGRGVNDREPSDLFPSRGLALACHP